MLAALERFATSDRSRIQAEPDRCLRVRDRFSDCECCIRACPVEALSLSDEGISLQAEACLGCGLCLHLCLVGVFSGDSGLGALLMCASRLGGPNRLELICAAHPDPRHGGAPVAICTEGCLAALGPSAYASLLALGIGTLEVRLDACPGCPIGRVRPEIDQTITKISRVLNAWDAAERVRVVSDPENGTPRPVYQSSQPPVSRRRLFQVFTENREWVEMLAPQASPSEGKKWVPEERKQLLKALSLLPPAEERALCPAPLGGQVFMRLKVDETCTACGICARVCPTGALQLDSDETAYSLTFLPGVCTGCRACLDLCEPEALYSSGVPSVAEFLEPERYVVRTGQFQRCRKCGARITGDRDICPTCDFRRQNPFGYQLPRVQEDAQTSQPK
jgi:ferredoxin